MKTLPRWFPALAAAASLFGACDRADHSALQQKRLLQEEIDARAAELAADQRLQDLEQRLVDAEKLQASEREAELALVRNELAQLKTERERAAERLRELETERAKQAEATASASKSAANSTEADRLYLQNGYLDDVDVGPAYVGQPVPETQYVERLEAFYEPLQPYGAWVETEDYGYVYQPSISISVNTWRPYTDGHWVHSDYGWTWASNEPFGWATYHYGRWARINRVGWCWVPGREWGPAWVSWRRGVDHCGWAPLPPESRTRVSFTATVDRDYDLGPAAYSFVALRDFGARSYSRHVLPPEENVRIINKTVNITHIDYRREKNRAVVYNGGPRYEKIRALAREPVQTLKVEFSPQPLTAANAESVKVRKGDRLEFAAPAVQANLSARPNKVREKIGKANLERGWQNVDPARASLIRQEIVDTSRPLRRQQSGSGRADQQRAPTALSAQPAPPASADPRERFAAQPSAEPAPAGKPEETKPPSAAPGTAEPSPGISAEPGKREGKPAQSGEKPKKATAESDKAEPGKKPAKAGEVAVKPAAPAPATPEEQPAPAAPEPGQQPPTGEQPARATSSRSRDEKGQPPKLERFQAQEPGQPQRTRDTARPPVEQRPGNTERQAQRAAEQQAAEAQKQAAAAEAQRQAAEEAQRQAAGEALRQAAEAQKQANEQAQQQAAEAQRQAAEQAGRMKAAEQSQRSAERRTGERQAAEQAQRKGAEEAQRQAQEQAGKAQRMAERQAQQQAAEQAQRSAQQQAQQQAEQQAAEQAQQQQAQQQAAQKAQRDAERQAQREAQQQAAEQNQRQAQKQAEQAQRNAEREAQRQAQQQAAEQAQQRAQQQAERAQQMAERQAQQQAAQQQAAEQAQRQAERQARQAEQQAAEQSQRGAQQQAAEQAQQRAQQQAERAQQMAERQAQQQAAQQQQAAEQQAEQARPERSGREGRERRNR
ncbi:MAG: hypothetical protein M3463_05110 [Verrucomicrobiota bacterium]|nr:hypothetical protein [Verrucomicrobiota bacterium]